MKTHKNNQPKKFNFTFIFLLGVIGSKWWINHSSHRIRVYLPESKRYIARLLKLEWGGTLCSIKRGTNVGVMWQTASSDTILTIAKAARKYSPWLPSELIQQLNAFTASRQL